MDFLVTHIRVGAKAIFSNNSVFAIWALHALFSLYALGITKHIFVQAWLFTSKNNLIQANVPLTAHTGEWWSISVCEAVRGCGLAAGEHHMTSIKRPEWLPKNAAPPDTHKLVHTPTHPPIILWC